MINGVSKMKPLLLTIALLFSTPAWADTILYCKDDYVHGIMKRPGGAWKTTHFPLQRHTLKFDEKNMTAKFGKGFLLNCEPLRREAFICQDKYRFTTLRFSKTNLRYRWTVTVNSWIHNEIQGDEPTHIGTCEKF